MARLKIRFQKRAFESFLFPESIFGDHIEYANAGRMTAAKPLTLCDFHGVITVNQWNNFVGE